MIRKNCEKCGKEFNFRACPTDVASGRGKYCSPKCSSIARITQPRFNICQICGTSKPNNDGHIRQFCSRLCRYLSQKGKPAKNKGAKYPQISGENNHAWKGNKVGYSALHNWIKRKLGKPNHCENPSCVYPRKNALGKTMDKPKRFDWANKSGKYKRELNDWLRLCVSCHKLYDTHKLKINA